MKLRYDIEEDALLGPRQEGGSYEENGEEQVGSCRREVHHLWRHSAVSLYITYHYSVIVVLVAITSTYYLLRISFVDRLPNDILLATYNYVYYTISMVPPLVNSVDFYY